MSGLAKLGLARVAGPGKTLTTGVGSVLSVDKLSSIQACFVAFELITLPTFTQQTGPGGSYQDVIRML